MRLVLRAVIYLVALGVVALLGVAIFSDLPAPTREIVVPVTPR